MVGICKLAALITSTSWPESPKQVAADHFLIICVQIQFELYVKLPCPSQCYFFWWVLYFFFFYTVPIAQSILPSFYLDPKN